MTRCIFCKGTLQQKRIEHVHTWGDRLVILQDVPVEVCQQCGETFFAPDTLRAMDKIVEEQREPKEVRPVPVFSLRSL